MNSSRDEILDKIKKSLATPGRLADIPEGTDVAIEEGLASVTPPSREGLLRQFRSELELVSGRCFSVDSLDEVAATMSSLISEQELDSIAFGGDGAEKRVITTIRDKIDNLVCHDITGMAFDERRDKLATTQSAIIEADYGIADIGSVALIYQNTPSNIMAFLPETVFCIIKASTIVANQFELFKKVPANLAKDMVLITGPSRTADIEKVLVLGAHGPKQFMVFVLQNE